MTDHRWGLAPSPDATTWWSSRAIYNPGGRGGRAIDILYDRQSRGQDSDGVVELVSWLNRTGLELLENAVEAECLGMKERREVRVVQDGYVLRANPRGSCGYLYLGCEPEQPGAQP